MKSPYTDEIQMQLLRLVSDATSPYPTHVFNSCLKTATFPNCMHIAIASGIHKKETETTCASAKLRQSS